MIPRACFLVVGAELAEQHARVFGAYGDVVLSSTRDDARALPRGRSFTGLRALRHLPDGDGLALIRARRASEKSVVFRNMEEATPHEVNRAARSGCSSR